MDQKPHSRKKTTESGSVNVNKGKKIDTGSRPAGSGGRNESSSGGPHGAGNRASFTSSSSGGQMPQQMMRSLLGGGLSLKKILIIAVIVIVLFYVLKNCDFSMSDVGDYTPEQHGSTGDVSNQIPANDSSADQTVSSLARSKRVTPVGGGDDIVNVMIYMCGTDLESKYGMATKDISEMIAATVSDKVNVIIETGGCKGWKNNTVASDRNQIYKLVDEGLVLLEDNAGKSAMTDPKNLTDFIKYCTSHYDNATRNILIFWDHGGGSLSGYGYDEKNPSSSSMTLAMIDSALKSSGCTFDWIGFDACLMATLETALVCNDYADYLIASEETEPGTGWDYTGWLTALSKNTSISTVDLSKVIIDDFVTASAKASPSAGVTLSVIDLAELQGTVPDAFREFATSTTELIQSDDYEKVADARSGVRQFAVSSKINQIDLVDLADRIGTKESKALAEALRGCVKYNRSTMSRCYGVSIYFPYESTKSVKSAVASYNQIDMDSEYAKCIQSFASLEYGGQIAGAATQTSLPGGDMLSSLLGAYTGSGSSTSPVGALLGSFIGGTSSPAAGNSIDPSTLISLLGGFSGRSMPSDFDWVDTQLIASHAEDIADNFLDPSHIVESVKGDKHVLSLTKKEWSLVTTLELNVFADDGEGFIDLGLDNTFEFDGDDLLLEYDGTWLTINGNACAYYLVSDTLQDDGTWTTVGRIPAILNGQLVNLRVVFDDAHPEGVVTGAYVLYEDETDVQAKGEIEIVEGDTIELLCDYYDYDGNYSSTYTLGEEFTVPASGLRLVNKTINTEGVSVMYRLSDLYGNHYWIKVPE